MTLTIVYITAALIALIILSITVSFNMRQRYEATSRERRQHVDLEELKTKISALEVEQADLREYVTRGVKKMSSRHAKAEMLEQLAEEARAFDEAHNPQQEINFDPANPQRINGKPKLVRK